MNSHITAHWMDDIVIYNNVLIYTLCYTSDPITSWQIDGETMETVTDFIFLDSKITADGDCSHEIKRRLLLGRKTMTNLDSILKNRDNHFANQGLSSQSYSFSGSHVWMWQIDHERGWTPKNWCFWTVVLEKTLESPLDCQEIQPVHPKGNQSWMFIGRTAAEAEAPVVWPPDAKSWLTRKAPDAGKDWTGGEGDDRRWDGWIASPTRWTWVWARSRSWWWTGRLSCCTRLSDCTRSGEWKSRKGECHSPAGFASFSLAGFFFFFPGNLLKGCSALRPV